MTASQPDKKDGTMIFAPATHQYGKFHLDDGTMNPDPFQQFREWYEEAKQKTDLAESLTLSTASLPSGRVSSRVVLLKELDHKGLVVYSNWDTSKKAQDLKTNKYAAMSFFWKELERQVRVEGVVEFLSNEESQIYFDTRPRGSRIGAWASAQSTVLQSRAELDAKFAEVEKRFEGVDKIPCPPKWGGLRLIPLEWEFFQGRKNRVHDRFSYRRQSIDDDKWEIVRLSS